MAKVIQILLFLVFISLPTFSYGIMGSLAKRSIGLWNDGLKAYPILKNGSRSVEDSISLKGRFSALVINEAENRAKISSMLSEPRVKEFIDEGHTLPPNKDSLLSQKLDCPPSMVETLLGRNSQRFIDDIFSRPRFDSKNVKNMGSVVGFKDAGIGTVHSGSVLYGGHFSNLIVSRLEELYMKPLYLEMREKIIKLFVEYLEDESSKGIRSRYKNDPDKILLHAITEIIRSEKSKTIEEFNQHMEQLTANDYDHDYAIELAHYFSDDGRLYADCRVTAPLAAMFAYDFGVDPEKLFFLYSKDNMSGPFNSGHMVLLYKNDKMETPIIYDSVYFQQTGTKIFTDASGARYIYEVGTWKRVAGHERHVYGNLEEWHKHIGFVAPE